MTRPIALLGTLIAVATAAEMRLVETKGKALECRLGDVTLWKLVHDRGEGKPYFHPVALPDGTVLTWLRPPDHRWHRALWFSWKAINGLNYWEEDRQGKSQGITEVTAFRHTTLPHGSVKIDMTLSYHPPGKPEVLSESRTITITPPDAAGRYRMDWTMIFTARDREVVLDRTPIPGEPGGKGWGGYAGLSVRTTRAMKNYHTLNSEGQRDMAGHGKPARWLDFTGVVDGKEVGIALFDHPGNERYPTPTYIIMRGTFGYLSPAFLFKAPYKLAAGKSLVLFYRLMFHPGRLGKEELEQEWKAFTALPHPGRGK